MTDIKPMRGQTQVAAALDDFGFGPKTGGSKANDIQIGGSHYSGGSYQHWDLATDLDLRHLEGASTKYISRFGNKPGESAYKDLSKARHYVVKLIEVYQEGRIQPLSVHQANERIDQAMIEANLGRFLAALKGPPARAASLSVISLLSTWASSKDLDRALALLDELIEEYRDEADTGVADAAVHTKDGQA